MSGTKIGDMATCKHCEQDIQFQGKLFGWVDRGNNRKCRPFIRNGEVISPKTKHVPYKPKD